jgi:hypothetical protein
MATSLQIPINPKKNKPEAMTQVYMTYNAQQCTMTEWKGGIYSNDRKLGLS